MKMEDWQREYVIKNLHFLIQNIHCDVLLIGYLRSRSVLSDTDISTLEARGKSSGEHAKTSCLIDILLTITKGYEHLTKTLFTCEQTGAFLKLLYGIQINVPDKGPFEVCEIQLNMEQFVSKQVRFGGKIHLLKDVCKDITTDCLSRLITSSMDASTYEQFLSDTPVELTVDTIPKPIPYYIPRTLFINTQLDPEIFEKLETVIFCIEGIELHQLSALSNIRGHNIPDKSRNQIHGVTTQFILLEHHDHFQEIADKTRKCVHWIKHENNNFFYVRCSTGSGIQTIQKFLISQNSQQLSEDEFLSKCQDGPKNAAILLYDSPGMGKSVLLASLARKTKEIHPNFSVIFLQISELISKIREVQKDETFSAIKQALVECISSSNFGQNVTKTVFDSANHQIEPFLDAFDEVPGYDLSCANRILNVIAKDFKNIRMYVTSRRHRRDELEEKFGMLGYNIFPFDDSNKLSFFLSYWQSEHGVDINDEIKEYAEYCLKTVDFETSCNEGDIAGIPLLCRMLAEIYSTNAKRGGLIPTECQLQLNSIFEVYRHFIDTKFSAICNDDEKQLYYDFHVRESLRTLFPKICGNFQEGVNVPEGELIYRIGILEPLKSDSTAFAFSHRTLAEYFAAESLASSIISKLPINLTESDFIELLCGQALIWSINSWKKASFQNPVVGRFLHFFLSHQDSDGQEFKHVKTPLRESKYYNSESLFSLLESSLMINATHLYLILLDVYLDLETIHKTTMLLRFKENLQDTKNWKVQDTGKLQLVNDLKEDKKLKGLVVIAAQYSSMHLLKLSCQFLESVTSKRVHQVKYNKYGSPMYFALQRGHYQMFEYILSFDKEKFHKEPLLYRCLWNSYKLNVGDKVQIVKRILNERPQILNKPHPDFDCVPLLADHVHFSLIKCLIEAGADLTQINRDNENIAHSTADYFSAEEYHELVQLIISRHAQILFKQRSSLGLTPVHQALLRIDLKSETLELLANSCNVNFNNITGYGSELAIAIREGRSERVITDIIRLGGDKEKLHRLERSRERLARNYNM